MLYPHRQDTAEKKIFKQIQLGIKNDLMEQNIYKLTILMKHQIFILFYFIYDILYYSKIMWIE